MFAGNGALGVKIFFVLSGFLIYNLSVRETQKYGTFNWKQFYMRRILRIFPCFYLFLIVVLLLMAAGIVHLSSPMMISAATFSLNYRHLWDHSVGTYDYAVIGHYWTLALEEQFYLTWPLLMLLFAKDKLRGVLLAIIALAPFIRIACYFLAPASRGQLTMMFHTGFDSIAAGVFLGELMRTPKSRCWLESLAANKFLILLALVFLLIISPLLGMRFCGSYEVTFGATLQLAAICLVITAAVSFPETLLFKVLNWRPLAYVGILSYSLYVWNNLFLLHEGNWFNVFPLNFFCVVVMALLSHYLVEIPFLRLKEYFHKPATNNASPCVTPPAGTL